MLLSGLRDQEIDKCFKENPELANKTLKQIALFFYIQGELGNSHERQMERERANYYRQKLAVIDQELVDDLDKNWNK